MAKTGDRQLNHSSRLVRGIGWVCLIAPLLFLACILMLPYRLEELSRDVTRAPSGCRIEVGQAGRWKSENLIFGLPAENLEYPLKVMIFVEGCPGVPGGKPYAVQATRQPSARPIAMGLDCGDMPQESERLCRVEVPSIPTRQDPHEFILKIVRIKGGPSEVVRVRVVLTRQWRNIARDALTSV